MALSTVKGTVHEWAHNGLALPLLCAHSLYLHCSYSGKACTEMPVGVYSAQAVVLRNKVYIGGGVVYPGSSSRLLVYDFTKNSWDMLNTPTQWYALATYRSQLVVVGGRDPDTGRTTNKLWVLNEQCRWIQFLPPMTVERYRAAA